MTAINRQAKTMLCAYCAVRKPCDRQHFPDRMVAMCSDCTGSEHACSRPFHCPCDCGSHGECFFYDRYDNGSEATP